LLNGIKMIFNILKSLHIFSVIAWMAGLLYFPESLCIMLIQI